MRRQALRDGAIGGAMDVEKALPNTLLDDEAGMNPAGSKVPDSVREGGK